MNVNKEKRTRTNTTNGTERETERLLTRKRARFYFQVLLSFFLWKKFLVFVQKFVFFWVEARQASCFVLVPANFAEWKIVEWHITVQLFLCRSKFRDGILFTADSASSQAESNFQSYKAAVSTESADTTAVEIAIDSSANFTGDVFNVSSASQNQKNDSEFPLLLVASAISGGFVLILTLAAITLCLKKRRQKRAPTVNFITDKASDVPIRPQVFENRNLQSAKTNPVTHAMTLIDSSISAVSPERFGIISQIVSDW